MNGQKNLIFHNFFLESQNNPHTVLNLRNLYFWLGKSNLLSLLQVPIDSMLSSAQSPGSEKSCNSVELAADKVFRRRDPKNGSGMTSYLSSSFNCVFAQATLSVCRIFQLIRFQIINLYLEICSSNTLDHLIAIYTIFWALNLKILNCEYLKKSQVKKSPFFVNSLLTNESIFKFGHKKAVVWNLDSFLHIEIKKRLLNLALF